MPDRKVPLLGLPNDSPRVLTTYGVEIGVVRLEVDHEASSAVRSAPCVEHRWASSLRLTCLAFPWNASKRLGQTPGAIRLVRPELPLGS